MSILSLTDLGSTYQQALRDYLEFFARHHTTILSEIKRVMPAAVPVFDTHRGAGGGPMERDQVTIPLQRYMMVLNGHCQTFVEQGGGVIPWLAASQAMRMQVLGLLDTDSVRRDSPTQSIILGLGLFLDLTTATISQCVAESTPADARFRLAFDAAPTGMVLVDQHGVIEYANAQTERMFGYSQQELLGSTIEQLLPLRFREVHRQHRSAFAQNPSSRMMGGGREQFGRRKDGSEFPVEIGLNPSRLGGQRSILAVIADISERKRTQEALVNKMWELQRSNEDLEQFAYVASHDLQEPLRMVVSYTSLLAERYRGKLDEKADKFIRYAVEGATRMQRLVADLLAYSRVGSQSQPPRPVNAHEIMGRTLEGMRQAIADSGGRIVCEPLPWVEADDSQLAQLFQNLISNALKFHGDRPPLVNISAELDGERFRFAIKDHGIGIAPEHSERIFQMFQRLHDRGHYEGSGIGLTIAKKIVERHRGRIWFESKPGQGATFFFTLPAATGEAK